MSAKFASVSAERANHAASTPCRVAGVGGGGFYARLHAVPAVQHRAEAQAEPRGHVGRVFAARRRVSGSPRVHAGPRREGRSHSRRRVARPMREPGPSARRGREHAPRTTDGRHDPPVAPDPPERDFVADRPDQVGRSGASPGPADVSYIPTDEGRLHPAAVKDMVPREVLGWSTAEHPGRSGASPDRAASCVAAPVMALRRHGPPPRGPIQPSDRGVQYASESYRAVLDRHGIVRSMSRRGSRLDDAPREGFFASLEVEHVHLARHRTHAEAKAAVFEYVEGW